jgi:hypothetical protein
MQLIVEQLPKTARDLVEVIGLPATLALVEQFKGRMLPVPKLIGRGAQYHAIAEVIGEPATNALCARAGGTEMFIPKCVDAIRAHTHNKLRQDFDELTRRQKLPLSGRTAVAMLVETYNYTERHIWRLLSEADIAGDSVDSKDGQMALF